MSLPLVSLATSVAPSFFLERTVITLTGAWASLAVLISALSKDRLLFITAIAAGASSIIGLRLLSRLDTLSLKIDELKKQREDSVTKNPEITAPAIRVADGKKPSNVTNGVDESGYVVTYNDLRNEDTSSSS